MTSIIEFFLKITESLGYSGVFFLMMIESSFIPFPSEIVVPPAGYLASVGDMSLFLVIVAGILGSLAGATINYFIAFYFGRRMIYALARRKFAKYLLISEENLIKSELFIKKYGAVSTFFGRLVPAVRQLISIPAGFSKMNYFVFFLFTALGSGIWVIILALLGYYFGENQDYLQGIFYEVKWVLIVLAFLLVMIFVIRWRIKKSEGKTILKLRLFFRRFF